MPKTILITGATDGIGKLSAELLAAEGHNVLLHGRTPAKLEALSAALGGAEHYVADLSRMSDVETMAQEVQSRHERLDILINNAGVLKAPETKTAEGLDLRFVVNTYAPYVLTRRLLPIIPKDGRIINLSSAAQAPVSEAAMAGRASLDDMSAYAQSKLAITIWTREMAKEYPDGPVVVAVNPGSLLASKMVREGFGVPGKDLRIGADILRRAALNDAFASASGKYFDNDAGRFADPDAAALDDAHASAVMRTMNKVIASLQN